ncbi:flagellar basal body P-ring formation chaperone FlgA [Desulfospira joergensenii]|uniref:flagellar basal body P-ring formation chaperone FlgA n=1 Tax=Desulfospira joergensenii TaxID=53329 RepID=UPI0003B61D3A|nr:flagellar basal body P-ring formation chaperone FlgA [Desulfospira joergensenii]
MKRIRPYGYFLKLVFLFFGLTILGTSFSAYSADESSGQIRIHVRKNSLVKGEAILLGEVADIEAGSFLEGALKGISLGDAPKPGRMKSYEKRRIFSMIQSRNLIHEDMNILCPERVYIKRESQSIGRDLVKERVENYLSDRFGNRNLEIEKIKIRGLAPYPCGEIELVVSADDPVDRHGRLSLSLDVMVDGRQQDRLRVTGIVSEYERIVCASRNLEKGSILSSGDLSLERINLFNIRGNALRSPGNVVGKKLKTSIQKGTPVDSSDLRKTPLVEKGDIVTLVAQKDNLCIMTTGVTQEDGYADELVLVENVTSGKTIRGFVRNDSTVEVVY